MGAFALAGLSGCIFSPDKGGGGKKKDPLVYYVPETPQIVLTNLLTAYGERDSVQYRKLFALNYQGGSYDTSTDEGLQPGTFTWADEVWHIRALAENRDILRVTLNLGAQGTWTRTPAVGPNGEEWAEIAIFNPKLEINFANDSDVLVGNEVFTFTFAPTTPAPEATATDTLWSIVRWYEDGPPSL